MKKLVTWYKGLTTKNRRILIMSVLLIVLYSIHHIYFLPRSNGIIQKTPEQEKLENNDGAVSAEKQESLVRMLLEKAIEKNDYKNIYKAQLALANIIYDKQEFEQAVIEFQKVLDVAGKAEESKFVVPILNEIGALHIRLGQFNQARDKFQEALEVNIERDDKESTAKSYHNLGQINYLLGKFAEANLHYADSIILHKKLKDHMAVGASYDGLAEMYARGGEYADAAEFQVLAINQYIIKDYKPGIFFSYLSLGQIYEALKEDKTSCRSWKEALIMVNDLNVSLPGDRNQYLKLIESKLGAEFCNASQSGFGRVKGQDKLEE